LARPLDWQASDPRRSVPCQTAAVASPLPEYSHTQIFQAVWGYDFSIRSHNLWVYVSYLRAKLEDAGEPRILHTVRGLGYVLRDPP
jgi:two-component system, OmpR family, response regulator MprA